MVPERDDSNRIDLPSGLQRGWRSLLSALVSCLGGVAPSVAASQRLLTDLVRFQIDDADAVDDPFAVRADLRIGDPFEAKEIVDLHGPLGRLPENRLGQDRHRAAEEQEQERQSFHDVPSFAWVVLLAMGPHEGIMAAGVWKSVFGIDN